METKLHTSLATLKALMLKIPATIVKKQEPHLMQDLLYAYHLQMKGKNTYKVGYCYRAKSVKVSQNKQWVPLSCIRFQ